MEEDEVHANMMIINRHLKTIEYFEPQGAQPAFPGFTTDAVHRAVAARINFPADFEVTPIDAVCPNIKYVRDGWGPQAASYDRVGTCQLWSLWFLHVRLQNPHLTAKESQEEALSAAIGDSPVIESLQDFIRNFAAAMHGMFKHEPAMKAAKVRAAVAKFKAKPPAKPKKKTKPKPTKPKPTKPKPPSKTTKPAELPAGEFAWYDEPVKPKKRR